MTENTPKVDICCPFCGQHQMIPSTEETLNMTEAQLEDEAIKRCSCSQAKSEIRKRERGKKLQAYIEEKFPPYLHDYIKQTIKLVEEYTVDSVKIKDNDGWTHTIKLDKDAWLVISPKKTLGEAKRF